jgi:hypothetical protein
MADLTDEEIAARQQAALPMFGMLDDDGVILSIVATSKPEAFRGKDGYYEIPADVDPAYIPGRKQVINGQMVDYVPQSAARPSAPSAIALPD